MKKILLSLALAACVAATAMPAFAQQSAAEAEIDRILHKQLHDSLVELRNFQAQHGVKPMPMSPASNIQKYTPITDWSAPRPPVGNFDIFNTPSVFGPERPSCMPYYEGCWQR